MYLDTARYNQLPSDRGEVCRCDGYINAHRKGQRRCRYRGEAMEGRLLRSEGVPVDSVDAPF